MISSSNSGLVVPIDLVAYCVGSIDAHERTGTFAGATTSYVAQASQDAAQAFLGANVTRDPNLQPPLWPLEAGIHLHWAAPDGLTHASQTQNGLEFPALPNRWLVTRVVVQGSSVTAKSWIIESDTLSTTPPGGKRAPTLPVQDNAQNYRYLGVWKVFDGSWQEPTIPQGQTIKALFGSEIHAVASGDIAFAAFYPNARGIFGFYDDTSDLQTSGSEPLNLMYLVTGWFSDPTNDPLTTHSAPADLQQNYKWTYTPSGATPQYSLYSGVAQDIRWNPATRYLGDDQPAVQVDVAIGNNPAEALAAYFRGIDHPSLPLFEQLFTALEMGLLSRLGQPAPGQLAELAETIHEKGFNSVDGGTIYTIVPAGSVRTGGSDTPAPNLPLPLADALNLLNELQQERDLATTEVQQYRWQLFADWYRLVQVNATDTTAANATLSSRLARWPTIQRNLATAQDMVEKQRAVVTSMLGSAWELKPVPAPRFWVPNEPVVLLAGPDVAAARRHGGDGRYEANGNLVCRLTTDLVSAATVSVTSPVTISGSRFSAALPPSPNHLPHAADVAALVTEACVLDTAIAAALTGGSDAALMTALTECLTAGTAPSGNAYQSFAGALPSPVEISWWGPTNPWLPLMMLWELDFAPLFPTASRGAAQSYAPGFFTANFTVDPDDVGTIAYTPSGGVGSIDVDPQTLDFDPRAGRAARYTGSAVLSAAAADNLEAILDQYLQTTSDATLQTILGQLQQTNILMQAMSGFNAALLTREQSLQLHIGVGSGAPFSLRNVTKEVQAVLPDLSLIPPLSPLGNGSFNPVRAGFAKIRLQILDTFGEKRPVQIGNLYLAKDLATSYRGNVEPGIIYLQPRLALGARVLFRWLSADTLEYDEMNAHPATSPVCGWLLPSHLQRGLFFYDQLGRPVGSLTVMEDATGIAWQSAPGNDATIDKGVEAAMQDQNPHLRDLAVMLAHASVGFFRAFYDAVDAAASSVSPPNADSSAGMAVLVGRPVALVQASLLLELQGITAYDQTWNTLVPGEKYQDTDDGLSAVQFPAVVGDIDQLDDGLVGYFKQGPGGNYDLGTFYTEAADAGATSGVVRPSANNLLLTPTSTPEGQLPSIRTGEQKLLMLMDPRAGIHLTTGILPTQYVEIPPAQYADTLGALDMTFLTAPVLRPLAGLTLPLPRESGYTWSWVEEKPSGNGGSEWVVTPNVVPPTAHAVWQYSPQQLTEGWLRLNPEVLAFTLQNASGRASVKGGAANTLTLTITNRRQADVTFNPGELANEGTPPVGSVFYIHFGALIDPSQVASVQPSAAGWTFQALHDAQYGDYWAATPAAGSPVTLGPGQALTITLADVIAVNTASQAQIYFDYYGVQGVNDGVDIAIVAIQTGTPPTASPDD